MSILIKGMEMPKNCEECFFRQMCWHDTNPTGGKLPWCPLIELPPHGRLIDADALLQYCDAVYGVGNNISIGAIINAPTIIEAEDSFFNSLKRGLEQAINGDVRKITITESEE